MPHTLLQVFRDDKGQVPVQEWIAALKVKEPKAHARCLARLLELERLGYEARRPLADSLEDGISELRWKIGRVHYRILYFFNGRNVIVLSHGLTKEGEVPKADIKRAKSRRALVESHPERHLAEWEFS